jgi:hypothetical protein
MYADYNNNPQNKRVGDCVTRALAKVLNKPWEDIHWDLALESFKQADTMQSMSVWGKYLKDNGFAQRLLPDTCPNCYTVRQFCRDNPQGYFVLVTGSHVIAVIDGVYFDTWDSGDEVPVYFFERKEGSK